MEKKIVILLTCAIFHGHCYSGFKLGTAIIALLHDDHETTKRQLQSLTEGSGRRNVARMIPVGIKHEKLQETDTFNLLLIAAYKTNKEALERLLALKVYVNEQNNNGRTALMLAGLSGDHEIISYLLSKGGDPQKKDFFDHQLKWYIPYKTHNFVNAIVTGDKQFIELYMPGQEEAKARGNRSIIVKNINEAYKHPENEKVTPLMAIAAKPNIQTKEDRQYYVNLAGKLIGMGVKINKKNNCERTALMYATMAGNGLMIQLLRESGAKDTLRDSTGKTFRDHAQGKEDIINQTAATHTPETNRKYDFPPLPGTITKRCDKCGN